MNNISLYTLILLHCSQLQLIWTINITTLKVIFKLYGDHRDPRTKLSLPNLFWTYWSAWSLAWFEWFKTNIVYSTICVPLKGEGHSLVQIGKKIVTKNLENTNNILMTKQSRIKWGYKILETGRLHYSLSLFKYNIRIK